MKVISGKNFAKILERNGWILARIAGSHHIYAKKDSTLKLSIPIHGNNDLKVGLLKHFLNISGIKESEL